MRGRRGGVAIVVPYVETTDVVESRGRLFVDGRRLTATDYRRMRRGLDKAVAHLREAAESGCLGCRHFTDPADFGFCPACRAEELLFELDALGVVR